MFRTLPPSAAPVYFGDLMRGMAATFNGRNGLVSFSKQLQDYFQVKYVFLVSSGKAALYFSLKAMELNSSKKEVVIPAYASFCLASAVAKAGLTVKLCDIDRQTLDFDFHNLELLVTKKTLAIIPVHNYGLVCNLSKISEIAKERGAYMLEDAAQAAGALWKDQKVGAVGDAGILSFGRGKNISCLGGGAVLTDNEALAARIKELLYDSTPSGLSLDWKTLFTGIGLSFFLKPNRYGLPARLPFLNLGANVFDPVFEAGPMGGVNAGVGNEVFPRLNQYNAIRIRNAERLKKQIMDQGNVSHPVPVVDSKSIYLRFPILFSQPEDRERASRQLGEMGLGANPSYPTPLDQIPGFKRFISGQEDLPSARYVAERILTLPTHPYVTETDLGQMIQMVTKSD